MTNIDNKHMYTHTLISFGHLAFTAECFLVHYCCKSNGWHFFRKIYWACGPSEEKGTPTVPLLSLLPWKVMNRSFQCPTKTSSADCPMYSSYHSFPRYCTLQTSTVQQQDVWCSWEQNWGHSVCGPVGAGVVLFICTLYKCCEFWHFNIISVLIVQYRVQT